MVATLVRLRLTLLRHTLRREVWRVVLLVVGVLWALSMLPSLLGGMVWLSRQPTEVAHDVLVVGGALLVLGWTVVPTVVPGLDDSLDVTRFRMLGVPVRRLVPGLLVASVLGVPTAFTAMVCLAPVLVWGGPGGRAAALAAVAMAPVLLVTCVVGARVSTAGVTRLLGARRVREGAAVVVVVVVLLVVGASVGLAELGLEGALERVPDVAAGLAWTPLGAGWAVPAHVADGDLVGALARAGVAVAGAALLVGAWTRLLHLAVVRPPARSGARRRRVDALLPGRPPVPLLRDDELGSVVAGAVFRRARRYWTADPRYLAAVLGGVGMPVLVVLLGTTVVDTPAAVMLGLAPLVAGTVGWGRHNDVAYDGSAFWMHVAARVPGWADRAGRVAATAVWAVPVVVALGFVGALVGGRPDLAPAAVGAGLGVLGTGLGVSAVSSATLVYPVPAAGTNPYAVETGAVGASLVAQLVTSVATLVLCAPVLAVYAGALWWRPALAWPTLAVGLLGGAAVLAGGVVLGGRLLDQRAVRLLTALR